MPDVTNFGLFLTAAFILSITPGPGMLYVLTRSLKGGRSEGIVSTLGNAVGGLVHVVAAALGLSAILIASALAFTIVKLAGAAYLIYLGIKTLLSRDTTYVVESARSSSHRSALCQGIITEVLNPKTALFFLAFIPQFINPAGAVISQFVLLGCITVLFNTFVDFVVAYFAGPIGRRLLKSRKLRHGQRIFSGCALITLGTYVAVADHNR